MNLPQIQSASSPQSPRIFSNVLSHWSGFIFILTALPLIIYPGVFIAGVMSLAAEPNSAVNLISIMAAKSFIYSSLLYPVGYLISLVVWYKLSRSAGAAIVIGHLALCVFSFFVWYALGD